MDKEITKEMMEHAENLAKISQAFHELTQGIKYQDRTAILVSLMLQHTVNNAGSYINAVAEIGNIFANMISTLNQIVEMDDDDEDEEEEKSN